MRRREVGRMHGDGEDALELHGEHRGAGGLRQRRELSGRLAAAEARAKRPAVVLRTATGECTEWRIVTGKILSRSRCSARLWSGQSDHLSWACAAN